ncbi:hypothetical protein N7509_002437 [Penicillium cosmopolitanum]|uniref:AMP-dependent synthetase/ligase domain-containing protein n=1 Tax=Penicillium cosmopolitanum TaxID=1131564 RepID=A0A9X0BDH1_9EURO|nr:uncharacterized protein N7509_002437 [Penicillium cosmopolitanum]KAJ5408554.1 hypothetical protein N7509_002437 [Penicillium cosmopolitanum]
MPLPTTSTISQTVNLPNDPLFRQLLNNAQVNPNILVHDPTHNKDATTAQLLHDVVAFQNKILSQLPSHHINHHGRLQTPGVYIAILAPLSYDFIIALYAVIALGAAAVPLSIKVLPEEGAWLVKKCNAICLLAHPEQIPLASQIRSHGPTTITPSNRPNPNFPLHPARPPPIYIGHNRSSKGCYPASPTLLPHVTPDCTADDTAIVYRAVNGLPGVLNLSDLVYVGARIELFPAGIQPAPIWERLRGGGVTVLAGATRFWQVLMTHYEEKLRGLPEDERILYDEGAQNLRVVWFGGGMPLPVAKRFWLRLRKERDWMVKYGASELGREAMVFRFASESAALKPIIGRPLAGTEVKLTDGDHGELLIKSPTMMIGYIDDEERTRAAFDDNGFYRTGDLVHQDDQGMFVFDGLVRFNGLRVSVYEVESHLCDLPYMVEAYVLSIPDTQYGHRVGALVVLGAGEASLTLGKLRKDLAAVLAIYKLPTVLRVVNSDEELPRSPEGKLSRNPALQKFFPTENGELSGKVEVWNLGVEEMTTNRAWDWGGVV